MDECCNLSGEERTAKGDNQEKTMDEKVELGDDSHQAVEGE